MGNNESLHMLRKTAYESTRRRRASRKRGMKRTKRRRKGKIKWLKRTRKEMLEAD